MRKLLHSSWISLLALALLAVAAGYYVGWTAGGLQRLVWIFNRHLGPVTLEIRGARGTLHSGLHIDQVVVEHARVRVVADGLDARIALLPLLWQTIRVTGLDIASAQVHVLPHRNAPGPAWQPHFLVGLLNIQAEHVNIKHTELIAPGGTTLTAEQLRASGTIGTHEIRIFDSTLRYSGFEVRSAGSVLAANPVGLKGEIRLSMNTAGQPPWLANAQIDGNLDRLPINGVLLAPFNADFLGAAGALSGDWHWQGKSQVRNLDLRAWGAGSALGIISGPLELSGDRHGFSAQGLLEPPGLKAGALAVDVNGNYAAHLLTVTRASFTHRASGARLTTAGQIGIVAGGPHLDLHGQWSAFRWPLADSAAALHSAAGSYTLVGLRPYALEAKGVLQLLGAAPMDFQATGQLHHEALAITAATVAAYGGQAQLHGEARWAPEESWSGAGTMRGLEVALLRPGVAGRVGFRFEAAGQGFGKGRALQAKFAELSGNIRGQRASGRGGIALEGDDWLLQQVNVQLGATHLEANGHLGAHPDLQFAIDAADLALLHDGARGQLRASGRVRGDAHNPVLQAQFAGTGIVWDDITLRALTGSVDFDPRGSSHADASLRIGQLRIADHLVNELQFTTIGTAMAHRFTLRLVAAPLTMQASGAASFADGVWRAELRELGAADGADLHLELAEPATLVAALNGAALELQRLCLHDTAATLCAAAARHAGQMRLQLSAGNVPLRALTAGLITDTDFEGRVSLDLHAEHAPAQPWSGELKGGLTGAGLNHHLPGGRVESFNLGAGSVQATLDGSGLSASVALDAATAGSIAGRLAARRNGAQWRAWPLSGELRLQTQSLGFIDSYVAQVDRVSGQLNANLTLAGTLAALGFNGELKVSNAEVDAYQINLALRELNFDARLKDTVLQLEGSTRAGADGHAQFSGQLTWRDALPYGQLHLMGDNLRVVNIPEARVQAAPDVNMKFTGRRIDVTGTVTLPYARLQRPDQLTTAVRASGDEVLVSANRTPPAERFHVFSDLTLRLGERVTIDTLGLAGRLSGSLRTVADDTGFNRGSGELQVEEGKYTAYGRKLDIERGRLQFSNGPLNDPAIDLRAVKKFPDIIAGVNVRGTLRAPRMTFFSDPAVSQSQIVSLLIAGGSLETVQNTSDPTQRSNAARNNMLLQGSALLFQQYGSKVGLDDVSVESNPNNNDTSLVLGRYLSPRLYVSYGISIAEAINTLKMRYTVGDHWTIKTEAGTTQSADLVYTIER